MWYQRYRLLLVIYGICLVVGVREYLISRGTAPPGWFSEEGRELTEVIARVNPRESDTEFLESMQALWGGDLDGFERLLQEALAKDPKHDNMMLRFHAQHLIDTGANWLDVNQALNRWRLNHPFDPEPINYYMDRGPRTELELTAMEDALERVRWIDRVRLEPIGRAGAEPPWRAIIVFRHGVVADVRDVMSAVNLVRPN
ncbi:MAG: hypothetical protein OXR82_01660 [Gammaproteobacteria bacterium]|nr:hypothetical protein [Gammaproteobacteria bacterium]MDE0257081.1 hypothetical protein [Gammaproteobacteria bacterium]